LVANETSEVLLFKLLAIGHFQLKYWNCLTAQSLWQHRVISFENLSKFRLFAYANIKEGKSGLVCHSDIRWCQKFHLGYPEQRVQKLRLLEQTRTISWRALFDYGRFDAFTLQYWVFSLRPGWLSLLLVHHLLRGSAFLHYL